MMGFRAGIALAGVLAGCFLATGVHAQVTPQEEYSKRLKAYQTISPGGETPFGEQINLYTGELTFHQTDIVLEGTGPAIVIARTTGDSQRDGAGTPAFGGWEISIPRIETLVRYDYPKPPGENWRVGISNTTARCTQYGNPFLAMDDWWHGIELVTEDGTRRPVLKRVAGNTLQPTMTDAGGQPMAFPALTLDNWQISCLPNTVNGEVGEAYLAISPNGTKYWLDYMVGATATSVRERDPTALLIPRMFVQLYATRIEDRFGNWIKYEYDAGKVQTISAKDGRSISIGWHASKPIITSITVQPGPTQRVWQYQYDPLYVDSGYLRYVVLPDLSRWEFSKAGQAGNLNVLKLTACTTRDSSELYTPPETYTTTVVSPTGAVGTFEHKAVWHARSYVPSPCMYDVNSHEYYENIPSIFGSYSLSQRIVSGPGLATQTWTYGYSTAQGSAERDACAATNSCVDKAYVDVKDPVGNVTRHTFSTRWGPTEGKTTQIDRYQGASTLLRRDSFSYAATGSWPAQIGSTGMGLASNDAKLETWMPINKVTIWQQDVTFVRDVLGFDAKARATSVKRESPLGSRTDATAYHDNLALWVMGQVTLSTNSNTGLVESKTDYDTEALPWRTYAFGKLQQTLTYNADGTLATVKDGNNNVTTLGSWKRGVPELIQSPATPDQPSGATKSAQVNEHGLIDWIKDENSYKTCYSYDSMSRLTRITYPSETTAGVCDTSAWDSTTISFGPSPTPIYGLPANHWEQKVNTGNRRQVTYFDALWQPVVQAIDDISDLDGSLTQNVTRYDAAGRPTFVSYPQRNRTPAVTNTWGNPVVTPSALGVITAYDALGRPTTIKQNSELGLLITTTAYLTGFQTRVTNPRTFQTTTSYMAFDQPTTDWPLAITHPEGAYTRIFRDVFGKPTALQRHNLDNSDWNTRYYAYDAYQRLCKQTEVETGTNAFGYDEAGNLIWSASALPWSPYAPCEYTANDAYVAPVRVDRTYDARHRLKTLTFPDGNGSQAWNYTPDSLPAQIATANDGGTSSVVNTFQYNKRRLLTGESQSQPGMPVWNMGYGYSANGMVASLAYPSGLSVDYAPNALGQPTRAGTYATGVSYYPNGAIYQFTYGNGILHTMEQNDRQLPEQSTDGSNVLNDSYDYDQNGNVVAISDGLVDARGNRDMSYDGLDRLKTVISPMYGAGGASYSYDTLDNLTRVQIGGAAVRDHYYCYDTHQQLTNIKTGSCDGGTSVIGLGYDPRGNLDNKNGVLHQFDYGNRLREVTGKESYRYDGHGRRVSAESPSQGGIYSLYGQDGALRYQRDERRAEAYDYITLNGSLVARVTGQVVVVGTPTVSVPPSSSGGTYSVQWTAVALATRYELQEALNGGAWQPAYTGTGTSFATNGNPSGSYGYRARACKNVVCGNWSSTATVLVDLPPAAVPALSAPANAANGNYSVTWTTVVGATNYTLEESVGGGAWSAAYTGVGISQSYSAKPAGTYAYRVKACNPHGCSGFSSTAGVTSVYPPAAPVASVPAQNGGSYTVSWGGVSGATSYRLEERVGAGAWAEVQNSAALSKPFSGKADGSYSYRVRACNNVAGCGSYSAIVTTTVLTPPTAVSTITTPAINSTGSYTVSWTAVAKATSYTLQRSANGGAWSTVYTGANRTFPVAGQAQGSYGYRVQGCNTTGCGGWSSTKTTVVQFIPATPASLGGFLEKEIRPTGSYCVIYVNWASSAGADRYVLKNQSSQMYDGPNTSYQRLGIPCATYQVWVQACNAAGCSAWRGPYNVPTQVVGGGA